MRSASVPSATTTRSVDGRDGAGVGSDRIEVGRFGFAVEQPIRELHTLHEAVVLVRDVVFPSPASPARADGPRTAREQGPTVTSLTAVASSLPPCPRQSRQLCDQCDSQAGSSRGHRAMGSPPLSGRLVVRSWPTRPEITCSAGHFY